MIKLRFSLPRQHFKLEIDTALPACGVSAIFGRSGCGKTSLLRAIAGFEPHCRGIIQFEQQYWLAGSAAIPTEQRRIGMVFQEASLFAHLTTEQNLLYGYNRTAKANRMQQPAQIIDILQLEPLLQLKQHQLSGGQRQRIALGRALLTSPQLMLLDEPFSGLDNQSKKDILPYLHRVSREIGTPMLLVSHQLEDVVQLADHILLLEQGKVVTQGPLQRQLKLPELAAFGAMTVLRGIFESTVDDNMLRLYIGKQYLMVPAQQHNGHCKLRIQARDVSLSLSLLTNSSICNQLKGQITGFLATGHAAEALVQLDVEGQPLQALLTKQSIARLGLQTGQHVYAQIKAVAIY